MILVQTPYGKSVSQTGVGAVPPYLVHRGYLGVIVDVAGTGGSEGQSMLFGEQEAKDGAELVEWAADLPGSNGNVGTLGGSYLGIDQVFTAAEVGPDSPLKAIFPIVTASDPYRDLFVAGGIVNMESSLGLIAGYFGLRTFTPPAERPTDLMDAIRLMIEHGLAGIPFELTTGLDALFQPGRVYDGPYWQERAPQRVLQKVVDNGVPAYIVGGQYDVFQRGEPLLYSGLQNAFSGRSVWEPMAPDQAATPRYQLLTGPWDHGNAGSGHGPRPDPAAVVRPLAQGARHRHRRHHHAAARRRHRRRRLRPHRLPRRERHPHGVPPPAEVGPRPRAADQHHRLPPPWPGRASRSPASARSTSGAPASSATSTRRAGSIGLLSMPQPGDAHFDTATLTEPMQLAGPVGLRLQATSTRPEAMFVVTLQDVAPDGKVIDITAGALLGSARAIDPAKSWPGVDGVYQLPYHPHTKAAEQRIVPGQMTTYDVELRSAYTTIPAGHQLRVLIQTGDLPHLLPPPMKLTDMLLGLYAIQTNKVHPSTLSLPIPTEGPVVEQAEPLGSRWSSRERARARPYRDPARSTPTRHPAWMPTRLRDCAP